MQRRSPRWLMAAAACSLLAGSALAQEETREAPNDEPSSTAPLFDRTDSGNVVQAAMMAFGAGQRELKRAAKLEGKLGGLEGKKLESTKANITKAYEKAAASFQGAIRTNPKMIGAYAGLSAAFRGSGKYAESLQVSARGLKLAPEDDALFAGWAESIMRLNMLGDATQAYGQLRETNRARAEVLIGVMKGWLMEHRANPGLVDPGDVERLAGWIEQQEAAAG